MKERVSLILRGVGIGFIIAGIIFFSTKDYFINDAKESLTEQEIILKAEELGMIKITQLDNLYLTDEELIEKAKELGMDFVEE